MAPTSRKPRYDHLLTVRPEGRLIRVQEERARRVRALERMGDATRTDEEIAAIVREMLEDASVEFYAEWHMVAYDANIAETAVGTAWTDYTDALGLLRSWSDARVDFTKITHLRNAEARVVVSAQGDEASTPERGIRVVKRSDDTELCLVEWSGTAVQQALAGDWTPVPATFTDDTILKWQLRGRSVTDDMAIYSVRLQIRGRNALNIPLLHRH